MSVKLVAEIGCNHNGDVALAKRMIEEAMKAGADAVKFQVFKAERLTVSDAPMAEYQTRQVGGQSQQDMLRKLELSEEEFVETKRFAEKIGIEWFATAFDEESVSFLAEIGQNIWKIPSGEITNYPLLKRIADLPARTGRKQIILSTGMASFKEIDEAVTVLENSKNTDFTILQCNTDYPTVDRDVNLLSMKALKDRYMNWNVGLSDHSEGILASVVAVGMGASFIEKHFTLDKNLPGPDHKASITPQEFKELSDSIRRVQVMLGTYGKDVTNSELRNRSVARKSIVAKKEIKKGDVFSENNLICKRPGNGISPMHWNELIGKTANRDYSIDERIEFQNIEWEEQ